MSRERFKLSVSVFLILKKHNQILMIKRAHTGWMDGYWSLPAGAIDGNETILDAVTREAHEEVGIIVDPINITLDHTMHCFTHNEEWLGQYFVADKWENEPSINEPEKHDDILWVTVDELPKNTIPYVEQAIMHILKSSHYSSYMDS